jgi:hypothetical protein
MELLQLIDTRIKPSPSIQLPTQDILDTMHNAAPSELRVRLLAMVYLRHALQRMPPADKIGMVSFWLWCTYAMHSMHATREQDRHGVLTGLHGLTMIACIAACAMRKRERDHVALASWFMAWHFPSTATPHGQELFRHSIFF